MVAQGTSSVEEWFEPTQPLKLLPNLKPAIALAFRKKHIRGFIVPGGCNIYIGLQQKNLFGVLGFSNPEYGNFDVFLKADTTPSQFSFSTDLLLFVLRTREVQEILEKKFCRKIETAYSMVFSQHDVINRYRKHGKLIKKIKVEGGFNLGYIFNLGNVPSVKSAKALWMQNHKIA